MNDGVYEVDLRVRLKEFGVKKPTYRDLHLWVLGNGNAEPVIRKAKKYAMAKKSWDMGYPLSVRLIGITRRGTIDLM